MVHLCGRPLETRGRCVLGRETAIQKVVWGEDDWLYLANGTNKPDVHVPAPDLPEYQVSPFLEKDDFDQASLAPEYHTLRVPLGEEVLSLKARKGFLRLYGRESLSSKHLQSLVARRVQSFQYTAETCVEFFPDSSKHMAGLVAYYNTENYYYFCVSYHPSNGRCLRIITCNKGQISEPTGDGLPVWAGRLYLRFEVQRDAGQFLYSLDGNEWVNIGPVLDTGKLSDDYIGGRSFTGSFIGLCCQDLAGDGKYADFDYLIYRNDE